LCPVSGLLSVLCTLKPKKTLKTFETLKAYKPKERKNIKRFPKA